MELLLACHANVKTQEKDGETALHLVAFYDQFEDVRNDADLSMNNKEGETSLDLALKENYHDITQLLKKTTLDRGLGRELVRGTAGWDKRAQSQFVYVLRCRVESRVPV